MDKNASRKRVGLFGGSYDPVHTGHLIIAQDAVEQLSLDELYFIPAAIPPHKRDTSLVSVDDRLRMLQLATLQYKQIKVSDIEVIRGGVSYTYDTVDTFCKNMPSSDLFLIIGSDTLVDLHNWYRASDIIKRCTIVTFLRPGENCIDAVREKICFPENLKRTLLENTFETHLIDISSTVIRNRIQTNGSIQDLVPPSVEQYIFENKLYINAENSNE